MVTANRVNDLFEDIKHTSSTQREVSKIHDEVDRRVLQEADVIGITTTGLAKRISAQLCRGLDVKSSFGGSRRSDGTAHAFSTGIMNSCDPKSTTGLSLESNQGVLYQLDRSQFERLSVGRIPWAEPLGCAARDIKKL
ncbi:hypothetical protein ED733_000513 [Metarhizium rileyi]|uniref:Uncharacterized protein n=1 Tax=Metarhizium rileyi (strain RCEF 4871) TaxID=1649241 RepID=A0A5C6FZE6_METRR|nr:hypothetical protein ED733_000513 [Metarhizium rileyi]